MSGVPSLDSTVKHGKVMCMSAAKNIHTAMTDLRNGKITPDEFRAIMRESKKQNGQNGHDMAKFAAIAASNR